MSHVSDKSVEWLIAKGECLGSWGGLILEDDLVTLEEARGTLTSMQGLPVDAVFAAAAYLDAFGGSLSSTSSSSIPESLAPPVPARACLFDMDGLLLNTEDLYMSACQQVAAKYGKVFDWSVKAQIMGQPAHAAAQGTLDLLGLSDKLDVPAYLWERGVFLNPMFETDTDFLPGALNLLRWLQAANVPVFLATSSARPNLELKLTKPEVRKVFEEIFDYVPTAEKEKNEARFAAQRIVCGSELQQGRGKPNPDIFLIALSKLNAGWVKERGLAEIKASECFVYEDSPAGVTAGLTAGMRVVHVPDPNLPEKFLHKSHFTLDSLQIFVDGMAQHFASGIFEAGKEQGA